MPEYGELTSYNLPTIMMINNFSRVYESGVRPSSSSSSGFGGSTSFGGGGSFGGGSGGGTR